MPLKPLPKDKQGLLGVKGKMSNGTNLPAWATDRKAVAEYQDWVNQQATAKGKPAPITNWGKSGWGKGRFGPQTASIYNEYGDKGFTPSTQQSPAPMQNVELTGGTSNGAWTTTSQTPPLPRQRIVNPSGDVVQTGDFGTPVTSYKLGEPATGTPELQDLPPLTDYMPSQSKQQPTAQKQAGKTGDGLTDGMNAIGKSGALGKYGDLLPLATNVVNLFRKPPGVPMPHLNNQITLQRVNMDNDRYQVESGIRGSNQTADRMLDENTSAAVKSYNLGQRFKQLSDVNQTERNENINISNKENLTNADIVAGNNAKLDQWNRDNVERKVAWLNQSSANLANMGDKYIGIQNERNKQEIENRRLGQEDRRLDIMREMYNPNKVATRFDEKLKNKTVAQTETLSTSRFGGKLKAKYGRFSTGGMMKLFGEGGKVLQPPNTIPLRDNTFIPKPVTPMILPTLPKDPIDNNPYLQVSVPDLDTRWEGDSVRFFPNQGGNLGVPYIRDGLGAKGISDIKRQQLIRLPKSKGSKSIDSTRYNINFK